jgi:hypothetical protein
MQNVSVLGNATYGTVRQTCMKHVSNNTPCPETENNVKKLVQRTRRSLFVRPAVLRADTRVSDACATPRPPSRV